MNIKLSSNNVKNYLINSGICQQHNLESVNIDILEVIGSELECSRIFFLRTLSDFNIVLKQEHYNYIDGIKNKVLNEWQLQKFLQFTPGLDYTASLCLEILRFDKNNSILIYKCPKDYLNLRDYYLTYKAFSTKIPELVGLSLASLHKETMVNPESHNFLNKSVGEKLCYEFPYPFYLRPIITPETFFISPSESMKFMKLYQRDESMNNVVKKLISEHNHYCLTNNSSCLDNILIPREWENMLLQSKQFDNNLIKIINWDNCSWGDPAFDLGTVIADYFSLWLNSIFLHPALPLEKSFQLAVIPLEAIQPSVLALLKGYISKFPEIIKYYPCFLERVIQFTGLALIYKIITMINSFKGLNNQGIFILKLSHNMLCNPEKSLKSLLPNLKELAW
ncbi:hypothetical protein [Moorena sp. SIO3I6]|uniref:hypothetical protein n=1 Tax=Moorena sp. SIO3I6 TaxID=2607831 RepID=UPI0013F9693E|nr:hypothetical protein [Moorena sp. SIO3I6]NEP27301.1 hypothetical protein [Moorena sp. SIO3I6]